MPTPANTTRTYALHITTPADVSADTLSHALEDATDYLANLLGRLSPAFALTLTTTTPQGATAVVADFDYEADQ